MLIHSAGNIAFLDNYLYIIIWLVLEGIDCLSREILLMVVRTHLSRGEGLP